MYGRQKSNIGYGIYITVLRKVWNPPSKPLVSRHFPSQRKTFKIRASIPPLYCNQSDHLQILIMCACVSMYPYINIKLLFFALKLSNEILFRRRPCISEQLCLFTLSQCLLSLSLSTPVTQIFPSSNLPRALHKYFPPPTKLIESTLTLPFAIFESLFNQDFLTSLLKKVIYYIFSLYLSSLLVALIRAVIPYELM